MQLEKSKLPQIYVHIITIRFHSSSSFQESIWIIRTELDKQWAILLQLSNLQLWEELNTNILGNTNLLREKQKENYSISQGINGGLTSSYTLCSEKHYCSVSKKTPHPNLHLKQQLSKEKGSAKKNENKKQHSWRRVFLLHTGNTAILVNQVPYCSSLQEGGKHFSFEQGLQECYGQNAIQL